MALLGHAVKLSEYGGRAARLNKLKRLIRLISQLNTPRLVIDYEGKEHLLEFEELEEILVENVDLENFQLFLTLCARAKEHFIDGEEGRNNINKLLELSEEYNGKLYFSVVAGNKAYLSKNEASLKPGKSVARLVDYIIRKTRRELLVGVEGIPNTVRKICRIYSKAIPFLVFNDEYEKYYSKFISHNIFKQALYFPYVFGKNEKWVSNILEDYLKRRRSILIQLENASINDEKRILECNAKKFAIFGEEKEVKLQLNKLNKFTLLFAYPLIRTKWQIKKLVEVCELLRLTDVGLQATKRLDY